MRTIEVDRTDKQGRKRKRKVIVQTKEEAGRWTKQKKQTAAKSAEK